MQQRIGFVLLGVGLFAIGCASPTVQPDRCPSDSHETPLTTLSAGEKQRGCIERSDDGDIKQGPWVTWYANGQKSEEVHFKDNVNHGSYTAWYANGQIAATTNYKMGKEDGPWETWFENGQKSEHGQHVNGKPDGVWTSWYESGQKESEGPYIDGLEHGIWSYWDQAGDLLMRIKFENGKEAGRSHRPAK